MKLLLATLSILLFSQSLMAEDINLGCWPTNKVHPLPFVLFIHNERPNFTSSYHPNMECTEIEYSITFSHSLDCKEFNQNGVLKTHWIVHLDLERTNGVLITEKSEKLVSWRTFFKCDVLKY